MSDFERDEDGGLYFERQMGNEVTDNVGAHVFALLVTYGLHYAAVPVGGTKVSLLRIHNPLVH